MAAEDLAIRISAIGAGAAAGAMRRVAAAVGIFGDRSEDAGEQADRGMRRAAVAVAALGTAIAGLAAKGLSDALNIEDAQAKLQAQLGLSAKRGERYGQLAGDLYSQAYGDSLGEVNDAIVQVGQNMGRLGQMSDTEIKRSTTAVLNLTKAFDASGQEVSRTVGALTANGMAGSMQEATDLITRGFQRGADKGGEFLDTLNEYAEPMKSLGFDARAFTNMLVQGAERGVYSVDKIGDAFKEFSIRAVDGSQATQDAYKTIGLDADRMAQGIAAGGPRAKAATSEILAALRGVSDPVKRETAGVALFGSMWEDIGSKAILGLNPARNALGKTKGAADRLDKTLSDTNRGSLTAFSRQLQMGIAGVAETYLVPALRNVTGLLQSMGGPLGVVASAIGLTTDHGKLLATGLIALVGVLALAKGASIAYGVALRAASLAGLVWRGVLMAASGALRAAAAAQWLVNAALAANPIGLIIVGIAALAAGFVLAYQKVGWFRDGVNAVWTFIKNNWPTLLAILTGPIGIAVLMIVRNWDRLKGAASSVVGFVRRKFGDLTGFFSALPGRIGGVLKAVGNFITSPFRAAFRGIASLWNSTLGKINFKVPGWVPKIGGKGFGFPTIDIGGLAAGGTVLRSGLQWVGERGPELMSLPAGTGVLDSSSSMRAARTAPTTTGVRAAVENAYRGGTEGSGGVTEVHVYVDSDQVAARVEKRTRRQKAITGRTGFR